MENILPIALDVGQVLTDRYHIQAQCFVDLINDSLPKLTTAAQQGALRGLDAELDNFIMLFETVLSGDDPVDALLYRLFDRLTTYFNMRGFYDAPRQWAIALIERITADDELVNISLLNFIAGSAGVSGNFEEALTIYDFILAQLPVQHPARGPIHYNLSITYWRAGNSAAALEHGKQAIKFEQHHEHPRGLAMSLVHLAHIYSAQDEVMIAFQHLRDAADVVEMADDAYLEAFFTAQTAYLLAEYNDPARTEALFLRALELWKAVDEPIQLAETRFNYAAFCHALGRIEEAISLARQSLVVFESLDSYQAGIVREALDIWIGERAEDKQ